jgi:hypothetical protein
MNALSLVFKLDLFFYHGAYKRLFGEPSDHDVPDRVRIAVSEAVFDALYQFPLILCE